MEGAKRCSHSRIITPTADPGKCASGIDKLLSCNPTVLPAPRGIWDSLNLSAHSSQLAACVVGNKLVGKGLVPRSLNSCRFPAVTGITPANGLRVFSHSQSDDFIGCWQIVSRLGCVVVKQDLSRPMRSISSRCSPTTGLGFDRHSLDSLISLIKVHCHSVATVPLSDSLDFELQTHNGGTPDPSSLLLARPRCSEQERRRHPAQPSSRRSLPPRLLSRERRHNGRSRR